MDGLAPKPDTPSLPYIRAYSPYPIEPDTHIHTPPPHTHTNQFSLKHASKNESSGEGYKVRQFNYKCHVIEVHFRFIGTYFDHNQKFHFLPFPLDPMGYEQVSDPRTLGVPVT